MNILSTVRKQSEYAYAKFEGEFDVLKCDQAILNSAFNALSEHVNGVLVDLTRVVGFELKGLETLSHTINLCCLLPNTLKYAFYTQPDQVQAREFTQLVFGAKGLEVKSTTDLKEAIAWLKDP